MAKRPLSILAGDLEERLAREATEAIEGAARARKKPPAKPAVKKPAPPAAPPLAARPAAPKPPARKPTPKKPLAVKPKPGRAPSILATPDLRVMDTPSAIAAARSEPHPIQDAGGQFVGAPRGATSYADIKLNRDAFDADVAAGAPGADWYTRARDFNREIAGPDPARQQLAADEQALWSAQATPDTNMNFALQGHNAYEMGSPAALVRTGQQARTYNEARDVGVRVPLGAKTGVYGQHLDPTAPHATTGTNDIWHARAFGFQGPEGEMFSRALTPQEHRFLDYETMLGVDRANAAALGGRTDWPAHEIQAAPWVAGKGRALAEQRGLSPEEGIAAASMTYPDYADKYTAFGTYEQTPYVGGGHLAGLASGPEAERLAFSQDPRGSWTDSEGRDAIYDALGLYQRPTLGATGVYQPPAREGLPDWNRAKHAQSLRLAGVFRQGSPDAARHNLLKAYEARMAGEAGRQRELTPPLELNPANVARPLVGMREGAVDDPSRGAMDLAEGLRAYIDAQGAGAWHKPVLNAKPGDMSSVFTPREGAMAPEDLVALKELGARYGLPDAIDTGQGVTLTTFGDAPSGADTGRALRGDLGVELARLVGGTPSRAAIDGGYQSMFELSDQPGSGAVTSALEDLVMRYPQSVRDKLDSSEAIRQAALAKAARDEDWAARTGMPIREDVQRARQIVGDEGLSGLFAARKRGEKLPGIMLPLLGTGAAATAAGQGREE